MLGGAAFLADSVLTPAVSISSAVEGLKTLPALEHLFTENKDLTMMITAVIIVILFAVQSRGTESIGKVFGSVVMVWFAFLAIVGVVAIGTTGPCSPHSTRTTASSSCSVRITPPVWR